MTPNLPDDVWLTSAKTAARAAYRLSRPPAGAHTAALDPPHNTRGETPWVSVFSGSSGYGHAGGVLDLIRRAERRHGVPDQERVDAVEGGGRA